MKEPRSALLAGSAIAAIALASPVGAVSLPSLGEAPQAVLGTAAGSAAFRQLLEGAIVEPLGEASHGPAIQDVPAGPIGTVDVRPLAASPSGASAPATPKRRAAAVKSTKSRLVTDARGIAVFERETGDHLVHGGGTLQVFDPRAGLVRIAATPDRPPTAVAAPIVAAAPAAAAPVVTSDAATVPLASAIQAASTDDAEATDRAPTVAVERHPLAEASIAASADDAAPPLSSAPDAAGRPIVLAEHRHDRTGSPAAARERRSQPPSAASRPRPRAKEVQSAAANGGSAGAGAPQRAAQDSFADGHDAPSLFLAFDPSSAAIDPQDLRDVAQRLADDAALRIQLTGYATIGGALATGVEPPAGSPAAKLGVHRSLAVRARLVEQGVDARRFLLTRPGQGADGVLAVLTRAA